MLMAFQLLRISNWRSKVLGHLELSLPVIRGWRRTCDRRSSGRWSRVFPSTVCLPKPTGRADNHDISSLVW